MKDLILGFPREMKIKVLEDALKDDNFAVFFELSKILLDATLNAGGIETDVIDKIHNDHLNRA